MSRFQVDVVATPRLDLCSAAAKDLMYRDANGKYPMAARSQMAKEQEKLNKFLQYVNESFIIKGFSKNNTAEDSDEMKAVTTISTFDEIWIEGDQATVLNFSLSHGDKAQILVLFTISGKGMSATATPALLEVKLMENNSQVALFKRTADGYFTMSVPFLLTNRSAGVTQVQVVAQVTGGEVYVPEGGSFGQALVME